MKLQMQPGAETIGHGTESYVVSNVDWTVDVPAHVGLFMVEDGRSGARIIEDPEPETCPLCGRAFRRSET